jgi:hypothetical protein
LLLLFVILAVVRKARDSSRDSAKFLDEPIQVKAYG